jgi:TolB-like protein
MVRMSWNGKPLARIAAGLALSVVIACGVAWSQQKAAKPAASLPAKKELLAVLDFDRVNVTKSQGVAVSNQLRTELLKGGKLTLVDRAKMDTLLNEQAFQQAGCTSQECAVQAGKVLGARKIVTGTLTKVDEKLWQIAIQLLDVESSEVLLAETLNHDGDYRALLVNAVPRIAQRLTGPVPEGGAPAGQAVRLAVFPCYFKLNQPKPANWQQESLQKGIESVKAKMSITVGPTFYPLFVPGQPILDTAGLESGAWSVFGNPDGKFIANRAAQWGQDAVLLAKTEINVDRLTIKAYVIDTKTQRIFEQEETISSRSGGIAAMTRVVGAVLLRYEAFRGKAPAAR